MRIPIISGVIDRRILVNYRIDPDVLAEHLPPPFKPQLVNGSAVGGICLIRLRAIRPRFVPGWLGLSSENAAHRFAVQWDHDGQQHHGVYIPRRDTSSLLNAWAGGRLFPGRHYRADFVSKEQNDHYEVSLRSHDQVTQLSVVGSVAEDIPESSVFSSLAEASKFFEEGSLGYSDTDQAEEFDGLELYTDAWQVQPLAVTSVQSSYFENREVFPAGSTEFDCALLMCDIPHQWRGRESLVA